MAVHPWRANRNTQWARLKHGATSLGITPDQYAEHMQNGEAWCGYHTAWEPAEGFGESLRNKLTGLKFRCRLADKEYEQARYAAQKAQVS